MANAPDPVEPPLVTRVDEPPLVVRMPTALAPGRPRPGLFEAALLTFAYWAVLIGSALTVIGVAMLVVAARGKPGSLEPPEDAKPGTFAAIPADLHGAVAWSFPVGYGAGLVFTLLAFRVVAGRKWVSEVGLRRLPAVPLLLGVLALPGFVVVSDLLGGFLYHLFGIEEEAAEQGEALAELYRPFPWAFAVLAVGLGPGLVEELWCRGFLGRGLVGRHGWGWGIALTSLFFGLLHVYPPPYVLITALMGMGLHYVYFASRSLWVPVTVHLLNNSLAVLLAVGLVPKGGYEAALTGRPLFAGLLAVGLLGSAGLALWSARGQVIRPEAATLPHSHAGIMVPPPGEAGIVHAPPNRLWTALTVGFCIGLIALIVA
jgi:membrane protease YdiL (CAAX protease family)